MKIERVALKGFLSHDSTDWSPNDARLVSLVGANGAGKSSLAVDGPLYALFDDARGRTDDLVQLGASEMSALVEFTHGGARYRVTRGRTTRSGGKSYLELAIANGDGWTPLTEADIRSTQARIGEILRMDADTFETSVLLVQGRLNRFAEATGGERKKVLSQVRGLDVYERAEAKARETGRVIERATESERAEIARLEAEIEELWLPTGDVERLTADLRRGEREAAVLADAREQLEATLRTLAGRMAEVEAARSDASRLAAEVDSLKMRWRRTDGLRQAAVVAAERARAVLERAADVEAAVGRLDSVRDAVAAAEGAQTRQAQLQQDVADAKQRLDAARTPYQAAVADFEGRRAALGHTVSELESAVAGMATVACPKCGERFAADPADLAGRLRATRRELRELPEPKLPMAIARLEGLLARAEGHLREHAYDPAAGAAAQRALVEVERLAAQAGQVAEAQAVLKEAEAAEADAQAELEAITADGKTTAAALSEANTKAGAGAEMQANQQRAERELASTNEAIAATGRRQVETAAALAAAQARQEAHERARARLAERTEAAATGAREVERYRRLVTAFGPGGIPARILEQTIPELVGYANELLEQMRPGMTLSIRTQRAKKSGDGVVEALDLIVQDEAGERPLQMFSGGERTSVSLALAVALSRLVARRAGSRIETLVVDEPDGLDADSRRAFGQALRVVAHRGELSRVVLVSHHADLAEFADAVYSVTKDADGSHVVEVLESIVWTQVA